MNAWLTRVLGGALSTVAVLIFGVGVACADVPNDHRTRALAGLMVPDAVLARTGLSLAGMIWFGAGVLVMLMGFVVLALRRPH